MLRLLRHGALAGLAGGAALAAVLLVLGEGPIGRAVALERAADPGPREELFGRLAQQLGGAAAALLFGVAVGLVFAVAFARLRPRLAARDDWRAALALAGASFLVVSAVPFVKYPPNPPAVGDPATIGQRSALYVVVLAWSLVAAALGWKACAGLRRRAVPEHLRLPASVGLAVVVVVVGLVALPAGPDPATAPAALVWRFRLASLAGAAALWAVTGTVFGWLRLARP